MMNVRHTSLLIIICFLILGGFSACLKDAPCHYGMQVSVYADNNYKGVDPVSLYIFNEDGTFREQMVASFLPETNVTTFSLNHLPNGNYQLVAWGNSKGQSVMPDFAVGKPLEEQNVYLAPETERTSYTPEELFHGSKTVTRLNTVAGNEEIKISRCISGIVVKLSGIAQVPESENEYSVTVEGTLHAIPFVNQLAEGVMYPADETKSILYRLPFHWDGKLLTTGIRYIFPSGTSQIITVQLFQNDKLIKVYPLSSGAVVNKIIEVSLDVKTAGDWFQVNDWYSIGQEEEI